MNKQEALVKLLEQCRAVEERGQAEEDNAVALFGAARHLDSLVAGGRGLDDESVRTLLVAVGGLALALLVDEVEVVEGRSLDEWLANRNAPGLHINFDQPERVRIVPVVVPGGGMRA